MKQSLELEIYINQKQIITMSKATKQTKATKAPTQYVYAYVFNGGVLKQNHCVVSVSTDHPETTIFNDLKRYYGNDIKGAFYKCSKTVEEVQAGIDFKLKKYCLGEIIFNHNFTETKKLLLEITGLKQCSGTINTFKKDNDADDEEPAQKVAAKPETESDEEAESENDAEDSEPEEKTKKSKSKSKSEAKKEESKKAVAKKEESKKAVIKKEESKTKKADSKKIEASEDEDEAEDSEPETKKKSESKTKKADKADKAKSKETSKKSNSSNESEEEDEN